MKNDQLKQILVLSATFLATFFLFSFLNKKENTVNKNGEITTNTNIIENYFAGKTIEWVVPFKEGGGADVWVRFNACFFQKHIPGNPSVIISNISGGGSIKGANLFAERVRPDGILIFGTSGTTQMPYLLDDPRVRYNYNKYKPIMAYPTGGVA